MPKINREEYEILKSLDDKWKWIARDLEGEMYTFVIKPYKNDRFNDWRNHVCDWIRFENNLFQFIQWEDEEPYNIAELIREYEIENGMRYDFGKIKVVDIDTSKLATKNGYIYVKESEETEVKKDIEWLREQIENEMNSWGGGNPDYFRGAEDAYEDVKDWLNQLDEPEVLSEGWIREHTWNNHYVGRPFIYADDLQNLLVPKQEEVDRAYEDGYEKGKQHGFQKGYREGLADKGGEPETVADVIADFYESCE